jgi:hypothetical protein
LPKEQQADGGLNHVASILKTACKKLVAHKRDGNGQFSKRFRSAQSWRRKLLN